MMTADRIFVTKIVRIRRAVHFLALQSVGLILFLVLPSIGCTFSYLAASQDDSTAYPPFVDTCVTHLLAEPLIPFVLLIPFAVDGCYAPPLLSQCTVRA